MTAPTDPGIYIDAETVALLLGWCRTTKNIADALQLLLNAAQTPPPEPPRTKLKAAA